MIIMKLRELLENHKTPKSNVRIQLPPVEYIYLLDELNLRIGMHTIQFHALVVDNHGKQVIAAVTVDYNNDISELVIN